MQSIDVRAVFLGGIAGHMKGAVFTLSACLAFWGLFVVAITHIVPG
jgi:hypothetical protein